MHRAIIFCGLHYEDSKKCLSVGLLRAFLGVFCTLDGNAWGGLAFGPVKREVFSS